MTALEWTTIIVAAYLLLGVASVWAAHKDLIADKWWAWLVVVLVWPLFWWHLFRSL